MFSGIIAKTDAVLTAVLVVLLGIKGVVAFGVSELLVPLILIALLCPRIACYWWCVHRPWLTSAALVITYPVAFGVALAGFSEGCQIGGPWSVPFFIGFTFSSVYALVWAMVYGWQRLVQHSADDTALRKANFLTRERRRVYWREAANMRARLRSAENQSSRRESSFAACSRAWDSRWQSWRAR